MLARGVHLAVAILDRPALGRVVVGVDKAGAGAGSGARQDEARDTGMQHAFGLLSCLRRGSRTSSRADHFDTYSYYQALGIGRVPRM